MAAEEDVEAGSNNQFFLFEVDFSESDFDVSLWLMENVGDWVVSH